MTKEVKTMKRIITVSICMLLVSTIAVGAVSATDWPKFKANNQNQGFSPDTAPGSLYWPKFSVGPKPSFSSPAVADGKVVHAWPYSGSGHVKCFNASTGADVWYKKLIGSGGYIGSPTIHDDKVFITAGKKLFTIDFTNGAGYSVGPLSVESSAPLWGMVEYPKGSFNFNFTGILPNLLDSSVPLSETLNGQPYIIDARLASPTHYGGYIPLATGSTTLKIGNMRPFIEFIYVMSMENKTIKYRYLSALLHISAAFT